MSWKMHALIGIGLFFLNFLFEFFSANFPFQNLIYLYGKYFVGNFIYMTSFLVGLIIVLWLFKNLELKKPLFLLIYYSGLFYLSGFCGTIFWLWITKTEL